MYFILLNQFVRFFLEPRYHKSRVFPCKLPSLISLCDMLHCTKTHQRPSVRWAKGSKPRWEQSLCTPEHCGLPHSLSCQNRRQEKEEHKSKDLHRLRNLRRFIPSPTTPTLRVALNDFLLPLYLSSMCFIPLFVVFSPVCVPFCHIRCAPAHPQLHLAALPFSSSSSFIPAHTLAKTAVCQLFWLQVMRFRPSICTKHLHLKRLCHM